MASSADYLDYVLDLLADVPEVTSRKMMGEYLLYASGTLVGDMSLAVGYTQELADTMQYNMQVLPSILEMLVCWR